mmetsp:Transcript_42662/g.83658  ORF Transcript_42662/g.83658 Transcript_42662/m.83658 type:complete len:81 (-) Transcript_42662:1927-2169(-)
MAVFDVYKGLFKIAVFENTTSKEASGWHNYGCIHNPPLRICCDCNLIAEQTQQLFRMFDHIRGHSVFEGPREVIVRNGDP